MAMNTIDAILSQAYDGLLLVHPQIQVLERMSNEIQISGMAHLNISKELSAALMVVSAGERSRFSQNWMLDKFSSLQSGPVLCSCPDLLFDPSLEIDALGLFRQAARIIQLIVMWPGEYSANILSYAVPEHHHFRTWKISEALLIQPIVIIQQLSSSLGA
ncbi:MAG: BREX-3 system P-loop-containing protein BrxF [Anaerolineaceae bacterium]|nr:BREX-3 system P-loop-containing protein BrxF [Anaerolineaceae bacterium]